MRKFSGKTLLVATHNGGKLEEFRNLLLPMGISAFGAAEMGLAEPAETEDSFVGNARIKAHAAAASTGLPALADDSGLCVEALGGAPGVHTADWAQTPAGRDFGLAMERTWRALEALGPDASRRASFHCTIVLAWPDGHDEWFEGVVPGTLVWPPRGAVGHGYDPMFCPSGEDRTFAEMDGDEKNRISHRAAALKQLVAQCFT